MSESLQTLTRGNSVKKKMHHTLRSWRIYPPEPWPKCARRTIIGLGLNGGTTFLLFQAWAWPASGYLWAPWKARRHHGLEIDDNA